MMGFPDARYCSAVFSPDGRYIAACHYDGMVRVWNVRTGQVSRRVTARARWATDVAFMPDGKGLISGSFDWTPRYWDISSLDPPGFRARSQIINDSNREGSEEAQPKRVFSGHEVCSPFYPPPLVFVQLTFIFHYTAGSHICCHLT